MIVGFANKGAEDIALSQNTKAARKVLGVELHQVARRKLAAVNVARSLNTLAAVVGSVEKLRGDRAGQYSIRINDQYRICFIWKDNNADNIEIVDYHR